MNFAKNCSKKLSRQLQHVDWDGHLSSTKCIFPAIVTTFALKDEWEGQKEAAFFAHCFFFFFHFVVIIQGAKTRVDFDILRIAIKRVLLSTQMAIKSQNSGLILKTIVMIMILSVLNTHSNSCPIAKYQIYATQRIIYQTIRIPVLFIHLNLTNG